jgi:hypothetical protein
MKLIRTASGSQIKLSYEEWKAIGKTAKWAKPDEVTLDNVELDTAHFNLSHYDFPNFRHPQLVSMIFNTGHKLDFNDLKDFTDKFPDMTAELARKQWVREHGL